MRSKFLTVMFLTAAVAFASTADQAPRAADAAASVELAQVFEDYFERSLELNPLQATFIGDQRYNDRLSNDISPAHIAEALAVERTFLDKALAFEKAPLSEADRLSLDIFLRERRMAIAAAEFPAELLPVHQFPSVPMLMPVLGSGRSAQPFETAQDYERFLSRMRDYVKWSDQAIVNMREGVRKGVVSSRVLMERALPQLAAIVAAKPEESLFWTPLQDFPQAVSEIDRRQLEAAYRSAIEQEINPAYRRLHDFIRDEYLPRTRTSVAWTALPDGERWYAFLARYYTTTDVAPQEIHELGLREVARIRSEMEQVMREVGFHGDLPAFFKHLQEDPRFYFEDEAALLQAYRDLKRRIDERLPRLFSDFPKADYEVRAVEPFRAASAAGGSY